MENTEALPSTSETEAKAGTFQWECPEFKVSGVFSSGMVLQRDEPIRVWGFSRKTGGKVTGEFAGETSEATIGEDNRFTLTFKAQKYSKIPQTMKIFDDCGHETVFDDILVGDVWFIGGQSNGELPVRPCVEYTPGITFGGNRNYRLFAQFQHDIELHQELCDAPQPDVIKADWRWKRPDEEASLEFSAIGWFFADKASKLIDIPLGMIMICPAGACISELMPVELAHKCDYFKKTNVVVGGYYNTAIAPFVGLPFKGMMFFQGESESIFDDRCVKYCKELKEFVADERRQWDRDFPFYNVQLSSYLTPEPNVFKYVDYVRLQQYEAYKQMENNAIICDMDLGNPAGYDDWPHSPRKEALGERIAKLILAKEYGVGDIEYAASPEPVGAEISSDRKKVTVRFKHIGGGLKTTEGGKVVTGFGFGLWDRRQNAEAELTGKDEVTVTVPENADLSVLTYAYENFVNEKNANLLNSEGIPAISFDIQL